jgi:hypothetical protein
VPIVPAPYDDDEEEEEYGAFGGSRIGRGTEVLG